jgi:predicted dinucleotide-binding enzyme
MQTVAFLGLGVMGGGMAARLLDAGSPWWPGNRSAAQRGTAAKQGSGRRRVAVGRGGAGGRHPRDGGRRRGVARGVAGANGALASAREGTIAIRVQHGLAGMG